MKCCAIFVGVVILPVLFFVVGCGGRSQLSRSEAGRVIQESTKFTPADYDVGGVTISADGFRAGLQQGFWKPFSGNNYSCTRKGQEYFSGDCWLENYRFTITANYTPKVKALPRLVTDVTGIADGPGTSGPPGTTKQVVFSWKWDWDNIPKEVKPFLGPEPKPSNGQALLKLYDDGWRVEEVH